MNRILSPMHRPAFSLFSLPVMLLLLLLLLIAGSPVVMGQLNRAKQEMQLYHYAKAVPLLEKTLKKGKSSETIEILHLMATCYQKMNQWKKAGIVYQKALEAGDPDPETRWFAALSLYHTGNYEAAKTTFTAISSDHPFSPDALLYAAWCDSALKWIALPEEYIVTSVPTINSPQSEFGALSLKEGLLFTSDRLPDNGEKQCYGWTGNGYLTLYLQPVDSSRMPVPFSPGAATATHNGPATLTSAEDKMMINQTLNARDKRRKKEGPFRTHLLKIYSMQHFDDQWSKPKSFFLNSDQYSVGHPALSPGGQILIFASDMPDGFGGTDLYRCTWQKDHWSDPVNLGNGINTTANEMFPYLSGDTLLWFASDGHPGLGGLDLYHVTLKDETLKSPVHPGSPLNTAYDDFSLSTTDGGLSGWFSSNRPGGAGEDDIYRFRKRQEPTDDQSEPKIPLQLDDQEPTATIDSMPFLTQTEYLLENIYYDFDQWDIREDAQPALDSLVRIMLRYPVTVELGSHTDCRGDEAYNLELSQKRAESAVQYIISKGIAPDRISARGYGKTRLINDCDCALQHPCSESEHQQNRRTTFTIVQVSQ